MIAVTPTFQGFLAELFAFQLSDRPCPIKKNSQIKHFRSRKITGTLIENGYNITFGHITYYSQQIQFQREKQDGGSEM